MTEADCLKFINELLIAFPAFDDAAKNSPDLGKTHRSWAQAWIDLSFRECMDVLRQLQKTGGIKYDEYKEPGPFIRRLVLAARKNAPKSEEDLVKERANRDRVRRNYKGSPCAAALAQALHLKQHGASKEACFAAIDRVLAGGGVD